MDMVTVRLKSQDLNKHYEEVRGILQKHDATGIWVSNNDNGDNNTFYPMDRVLHYVVTGQTRRF